MHVVFAQTGGEVLLQVITCILPEMNKEEFCKTWIPGYDHDKKRREGLNSKTLRSMVARPDEYELVPWISMRDTRPELVQPGMAVCIFMGPRAKRGDQVP